MSDFKLLEVLTGVLVPKFCRPVPSTGIPATSIRKIPSPPLPPDPPLGGASLVFTPPSPPRTSKIFQSKFSRFFL